jgi:ABC-type transport system involved in cytochrome c biogenesis permease subunit
MDQSPTIAAALAGLCGLTALVCLLGWIRRPAQENSKRSVADVLGWGCLLLALVVWALRWRASGHLPLFGTYESALSLTLSVLAAAAIVRARHPQAAGVWAGASALSALLLAHGLRYDLRIFALTISERSLAVDLHAILAWAAFGTLAVNACLALVCLAGVWQAAERRLPFSLSLGFLLHSAMLASGSYYKFLLFGQAWSFDPIETLGFVAWVSYGTLLHMHLFAGWNGRRLAGWCLGLFVILVVSYRGIVLFPSWSTYHIFDMDLRIHDLGR